MIIFSMGNDKIPEAPASFKSSLISQNLSSFITACTAYNPSSESGNIVGLFNEGII